MKEIILNNFRCFEQQKIKFKKNINVLIGDNASGKTSVINACKYVLSSFFAGFSDDNTRWISPTNHDFREVITEAGTVFPEEPIVINFKLATQLTELFDFHEGDLFDETFSLRKNNKKNARALVSGIKLFRANTQRLQKNIYDEQGNRTLPLPVFSFFSTEDIHKARKIERKRFTTYAHTPSFGYYECLEGNGLFDYWILRLLALKEGQKMQQEIDIVRQAIIDALGSEGCEIIEDIMIRPIKKEVFFKYSDGREVESSFLSDGYKRLVYIVMDVAFRCALLNREIYGDDAARQSFGTVLIDELDMHLHPALQARILKGLSNAFPNIQFIVTTHAPLIMSTVASNDNNAIIQLTYNEIKGHQVSYEDFYGWDASNIIELFLDQSPRDMKIDKKLDALFDLIDNDELEAAKIKLQELKTELSENLPDLQRAESMINFLEP